VAADPGSGLERLLRPGSVAVVGASRNPAKRGFQAIRALQRSGFAGAIYPVHPDGGELLGLDVYPSVRDLPEAPDLAVVAVAAPRVPAVVEACGAGGIQGAIVLAVGFRESGAGGARLEDETVAAARRTGLRIIGPNTSGVLNPHIGLNLVGADAVRPGSLALLSQSGNIGLDVMTRMRDSGPGLSLYVGVGNESDVGFDELLEYIEKDPTTSGVLVYAEGFRNGRAFLRVAERVNRIRPVVILKGGRSRRGEAVALSHTGAIAGSYEVFRSLAAERGLEVVERSDEFLAVGAALTLQPPARSGAGIIVVADGGGHSALAADRLAELGLAPCRLGDDVRTRLGGLLGPAAATGNPIDLAGAADARPAVFAEVVRAVTNGSHAGGLLVTGLFGGYAVRFDPSLEAEETGAARAMAAHCRAAGLPLVVHTMFGGRTTPALLALREAGVPVTESLETAVRCLAALVARGLRPRRAPAEEKTAAAGAEAPRTRKLPEVRRALAAGRRALTEWETRTVLERFDVPLVPTRLCREPAEMVEAVRGFPPPAVAKLVSPSLLHRAAGGGVVLDIVGPQMATEAYERLRGIAERQPDGGSDAFHGVIVSPQLPPPLAELLVAARLDPQFGPVLVVGAGGVDVEVAPDRAVRSLPLASEAFADLIESLRIGPTLRGRRGAPGVDLNALESLCSRLARCLLTCDGISEIELNPVFATASGAVAVDALAVL
jgi:acetyltransferase